MRRSSRRYLSKCWLTFARSSRPRPVSTEWASKEPPMLVATTNDLAGHRIVRHLGLVRGIVVRSRSIIGNVGATIQSLFGGNITLYTTLCEKARADAFDLMMEHGR